MFAKSAARLFTTEVSATCGLIKLPHIAFDDFSHKLQNNDAVVLVGDRLFYGIPKDKRMILLAKDKENAVDYQALIARCDATLKAAGAEDMQLLGRILPPDEFKMPTVKADSKYDSTVGPNDVDPHSNRSSWLFGLFSTQGNKASSNKVGPDVPSADSSEVDISGPSIDID